MFARIITALSLLLITLVAAVSTPAQTQAPETSNVASQVVSATASPDSAVYPPSPERLAQLVSYSRFVNIWRFAEFFLSVAVLLIVLFSGLSARLRDWAALLKRNWLRQWLYFGLLMVAVYILDFPANYYRNFVVENQYGFLNQNFMQWWGESLLALLVTVIFGVIPVWLLYFVISRFRRWWLVFSLGAVPVVTFFIVVAPVVIAPLFNKYQPLTDKTLETKLLTLADKAGIPGSHVFEVNASKQSTKVSAYVTGLFNTKRIVLYDTLIKNFTHDEIMFVMGHEMGHYVMNHIWIGLGVLLLFILGSLWLINRFIHDIVQRYKRRFGFERIADIASLPLLLLCLNVVMFIGQPVTNAASRMMEHASDTFGMDQSGVSGETAASAFDKLSVLNLSDPDPNPLIEFWFYDHPAIKKRIEYVKGYTK
jgi:Zn-dependent protease with chaperone function